MRKIKNIIEKFYYIHIKRDKIAYARKKGVRIGENCQLLADPSVCFGSEPWLIKIGNHVDITLGVEFLNHEGGIWCARGIDDKYNNYDCFAPISVGDNVMIGVHSLIMPGVKIGNNVIIGGHSVVTKDVADGAVVAGIPAKEISTVEKFMSNLEKRELTPTKKMTQNEKREYLSKMYSDWF